MKRDSIHTLVLCALLSAFALALSYIETLFPLPLPVPGARLGLGNALVLLALLTLGPTEAAGVLLTKTALSALLFGTPVSFLYAAASPPSGNPSRAQCCTIWDRCWWPCC